MSIKDRLSVIILCAGEGKRLSDISQGIPKPILKFTLEEKCLLELTFSELLKKIKVKKIYIVCGFEANRIVEFTKSQERFTDSKVIVDKNVFLLNAEDEYKKGPFHSFLKILDTPELSREEAWFLLIPGDVYFLDYLITRTFEIIKEQIRNGTQYPIMFYRKIDDKIFDSLWNLARFSISSLELEHVENQRFVKSIQQIDLSRDLEKSDILQAIPIFYFPRNFLHFITQLKEENLDNYSKLTDFLNEVYLKKERVIAIEIDKENEFWELDTPEDLDYIGEMFAEMFDKRKNGG